jgi:hypothetical protein
MRGTSVLVVLAGIGGALLPMRAIGGPVTHPPLIIRIYDGVGLASERLATARHAVSAVLKPAGIDITWRDCRGARSDAPGHPCNAALEASEVIVRIVNAGSKLVDDRLGYSSVDVQHHADCLATVFADRVEAMAGRTQSDPGTLLGHVIAHEIGHLLMGTSAHSPIGLMRGRWSDDEVRRRRPIDWQLTRKDAKSVRVGLLERSRGLGRSAAAGVSARATTERVAVAGGTLRLAAATAWRPRNADGKCAELDSVRGTATPVPIAQPVRNGFNLLVQFVQRVFVRLARIERRHEADDSFPHLKRQEGFPSSFRCLAVGSHSAVQRM